MWVKYNISFFKQLNYFYLTFTVSKVTVFAFIQWRRLQFGFGLWSMRCEANIARFLLRLR